MGTITRRAAFTVITTIALLAIAVAAPLAANRADYTQTPNDPSAPALLPEYSRSYAVLTADFNDDGTDDIQLSRHQARKLAPSDVDGVWVFHDGDYKLAFELPQFVDRHGCAAADVNADGMLDMYCQKGASNGRLTNDAQSEKKNEMWIQQPAEPGAEPWELSFVDRSIQWKVTEPNGRGRQPVFLDYDSDGKIDLYTTNAPCPASVYENGDTCASVNMLYRNTGTKFVAKPNSLVSGINTKSCIESGDFNDDDFDDLILCEVADPARGDNSTDVRVYMNKGNGTFKNATNSWVGTTTVAARDLTVGDIDSDGVDDLALTRSKGDVDVRIAGADKWRTVDHTIDLSEIEQAVDPDSPDLKTIAVAIGDFGLYVVTQDILCSERGGPDKYNSPDWVFTWNGSSFDTTRVPLPEQGCGDVVGVLDGDAVIVLNGDSTWRGPVWVFEPLTAVFPPGP